MLAVQIPVNIIVILTHNIRVLWNRRAFIKAQISSCCSKICRKKLASVVPDKNKIENLTNQDLIGPKTLVTVEDLVDS